MPFLKRLIILFAFLISSPAMSDQFREGLRALQLKENEKAAEVFHRLAADDNRNAQFMLGVLHEGGYGVGKDLKEAARWYLKAAEAGVSSAQYNLGIFYQFGHGVRKSDAEAFAWHSRAAGQGHASAQNNLASLYFAGNGVDKDLLEAWKWYEISAKKLKGDAKSIALINRDKVGQALSNDQLSIAKRRATDFRPTQE